MYGLYIWTAVLGTALLALQFLGSIFGMDGGHHDVQFDPHGDVHADAAHGTHDEGKNSINLRSFRGFAVGLAIFGTVGGLSKSLGAGTAGSLVIALVAATAAYLLTAWSISKMLGTETNGAVQLTKAEGLVGTVYRSIEGREHQGTVAVSINGMLVHIPAVSSVARLLKFGERVKILTIQGGVATVAPAESE